MKKIFVKYREMSYEQRLIFVTVLGLCFSAVLTCAKLLIGIFSDFNLCIIAVYTFALLLSKLECVLGARSKRSFKWHNLLIAAFLFFSSAIYLAFLCRSLFAARPERQHDISYVALLALISFLELGFAVAGILRTKNRGQFYRDIKIINFCMALIALLTTQITILDFTATSGVDRYNAYTGMGIGIVIALCAVYIAIAPKISLFGRERQAYRLKDGTLNRLADMKKERISISLCQSVVYGSYFYAAEICGAVVNGKIRRGDSLWKKMPLFWKIVCCILSEILIFVWLIGRFIFFLRSADLPGRLDGMIRKNGFEKIKTASEEKSF